MPVGRSSVTGTAGPLAAAVTDATEPLMRLAGRLLGAGMFDDAPDQAWLQLEQASRRARQHLREALRQAVPAVATAYMTGADALLAELVNAGAETTANELGAPLSPLQQYTTGGPLTFDQAASDLPTVNAAVREAAADLMVDLDGAFTAATARLDRAIREASNQAGFTGLARETLRNAAWNRFLDRGLTIPDNQGRNLQLGSWAEALCETRLTQTATDAYLEFAGQAGIECVVVSVSLERCTICRPWEGRLLATGDDALTAYTRAGGRPVPKGTLATAVAAGLFHPYCRHEVSAWMPGVTALPDRGPDNPGGYAAAQREREIERAIEKWERKADLALTRLDRLSASRRVNEWRAKLTEHRAVASGFLAAAQPAEAPDLAAGLAAIFQSPSTRGADTDRDADFEPGTDAVPSLGVPPAAMLAGGDPPEDVRTLRRLRQAASDAADAFTSNPNLNPDDYLLRMTAVKAQPSRTAVTYQVLDENDDPFGAITVFVTDGGDGPEVTLSAADAYQDYPTFADDVRSLATDFVDAWNASSAASPDERVSTLGVDPAGVLFEGTSRDARAVNYARSVGEQAAEAYADQFGDYVEFDDLTVVGTTTYVDFLHFPDPGDAEPAGRFRIGVTGTSDQAETVEVTYARAVNVGGDDRIDDIAAQFADAWQREVPAGAIGGRGYPVLASDMFGGSLDAVRDGMYALLEEHDYDGFTVEVASAVRTGKRWKVKGDLLVDGVSVGSFERSLEADGDRITVHHDFLSIEPEYHGSGIATSFNRHLTDWYRASGVESIRVYAALEAGGYAWARAEFEWAWESEATKMFAALTQTATAYRSMAAARRRQAAHRDTPPASAADLLARADELEAQAQAAFAFLERVDQTPWGDPNYPQPYDVSEIGRPANATRDQHWIGKETLIATSWHGVKWIND